MCILGPGKIVLGEIALFEDFGTTLCKDTEKSCWSEKSHYNYSAVDANFLVPKPKPCWSEIRFGRNCVRRGLPVSL